MGDRAGLTSGDVFGGRYELCDVVSERRGSVTWRAHDAVLNRNVGVDALRSTDPRAQPFLAAARASTTVTDPRFLRVVDLIEDAQGHHLVVREWARAYPLDSVLASSPLPNHRAAAIVYEVARAIDEAHQHGVRHQCLTPHHVLLKRSGAVRIAGLGTAAALAPPGHDPGLDVRREAEHRDVEALGKLLYACLVSRWPGAETDSLDIAPTDHGRLMRPRQVRAGVSTEIDTVCDQILGDPPDQGRPRLGSATEVAAALEPLSDPQRAETLLVRAADTSPADVLRLDPVVVPHGPPPGLAPPRRRPRALQPSPPSASARRKERAMIAARGDRGLLMAGLAGVVLLAAVLAGLVGWTVTDDIPGIDTRSEAGAIPIVEVTDFDPQGQDGQENPESTALAVDGDPSTGWPTAAYYGQPDLGGLKEGVGVALDLGGPVELEELSVRLAGSPTTFSVLVSSAQAGRPRSPDDLRRVARVRDAGTDAVVNVPDGEVARYVVIWLERLPRAGDAFRGEIREISVRGRS